MPSQASKLLAGMRQTSANWKRRDLDTLYLGFGFTIRPGKKHDVAKHPDYPTLRATLPNEHKYLANEFIRTAVKLVDQLQQLKEQNKGGGNYEC